MFGSKIAAILGLAMVAAAGLVSACGSTPETDASPARPASALVSHGGAETPRLPSDLHPLELAELDDAALERMLRLSPLPPPPADPTNRWAEDARAAHLGQFLFYDERLSGDGSVSCATCHQPEKAWADGRSFGVGLAELERHSMSLLNVAYNRWFFWDGRIDSLWAQALQPLEDEREHGGSRLQFAHMVAADRELREAYEQVFGELPQLEDETRFPPAGRPVPGNPAHPHNAAWSSMAAADQEAVNRVFANLGKAIAAFERRLLTKRSRFDEFIEGWRAANPSKMRSLESSARRGLALFVGKANCHLCHHGPNFSDLEFHNTRVPPHPRGEMYDPGRFEGVLEVQQSPFRATERWSDAPQGAAETKIAYLAQTGHNWGEFKTPSLRNVALSAPYMHQGQFATLFEVVEHYSTLEKALPLHQHSETILKPLNLAQSEIADLVAFLQALTDDSLDPALKKKPHSPLLAE